MKLMETERREVVDRSLREAEGYIEVAMIHCDDPDERSELLEAYRGVLNVLYRYHDDNE